MTTASSSALTLLSIYDTNSESEDDVPGPRVSVKRCLKDDDSTKPNKYIKKLESTKLPLPAILQPVEIYQDPKNKIPGGRIRTFPHERGNWSTYVYIPYEHSDILQELINEIILTSKHIVLEPSDDFHISLTKTVILRHHWIQAFVKTISENISHIKGFIVLFEKLKIYCNEERTRTFIGLKIKSGHDSLLNIVNTLNKCLAEFNLPEFYMHPSFHMSLLWCVGDHEAELATIIDHLNDIFIKFMSSYPDSNWYIHVKNVMCKTGNKIFNFNLCS